MLNFNIQSHRPLREIVYEEIKDQILTGKIKPGIRLMEVDLAEGLNVSRTPIREAIRKLEKEGLVIIEPRKGAYASQISTTDMIDILEVRQNLEGLAAYFACFRMNDEQLRELREAHESYNSACMDGDAASMIKFDTRFHRIIVDSSHNKILIKMVEQLQELVLRFRYIYYDDFRRSDQMPKEHAAIIEAIAGGDCESAKAFAYEHIDRLKEMVVTEGV